MSLKNDELLKNVLNSLKKRTFFEKRALLPLKSGLFLPCGTSKTEKSHFFRDFPDLGAGPRKCAAGGRPYRPLFSGKSVSKPTESLGPWKPDFQNGVLDLGRVFSDFFRDFPTFPEISLFSTFSLFPTFLAVLHVKISLLSSKSSILAPFFMPTRLFFIFRREFATNQHVYTARDRHSIKYFMIDCGFN